MLQTRLYLIVHVTSIPNMSCSSRK